MKDNRRFQRVNYLGSGWLHHNESRYNCLLKNISKNGILVSLKKEPSVPFNPGDKCSMKLHLEEEGKPYHQVEARIVRSECDVAGLEFTEAEIESDTMLDTLIQREQHLIRGSKKLIDLGRKVAKKKGVGLKVVHFDKGELNPEREIHTLRLSAGGHSINVHLHRQEIEAFYTHKDAGQISKKIYHAIDRLNASG